MEKDKDGLVVKLSVTDTDVFQEVLNILIYAYEKLPESEKGKVYNRIDRLLGRDYAVDLMLKRKPVGFR